MGKVLPAITDGLRGFIERTFPTWPGVRQLIVAEETCQAEKIRASSDGLPTRRGVAQP